MKDLASYTETVLAAWRSLPLGAAERGVVKAAVIGATLFLVIYGLERLFRVGSEHYRRREFLHDAAYWFYYRGGFHRFLFLAALFGALAEPLAVLDLRLLQSLPFAVQVLVYMAVADFFVYWIHRAQHHFPFLWAFHSTHHSQQHLNFVTSQRVHPVDHLIQDVLIYVPLLALGFDESAWMPMYLIGEFHLAAQHSRLPWRFGPLYSVIVSPVFHSYHHSTDPEHHNRNFAGVFSFWDYVFRTAIGNKRPAPTKFGLDQVVPTSLASTLTAPFAMLKKHYQSVR